MFYVNTKIKKVDRRKEAKKYYEKERNQSKIKHDSLQFMLIIRSKLESK